MYVLSSRYVKSLLTLEPETGHLLWRYTRGSKALCGQRAGWIDKDGYRRLRIDGQAYAAHRIVWLIVNGSFPNGEIDHINGVRDDNRIENLRVATRSQNQANRKKNSRGSTGIKGVHFHRRHRKFQAHIGVDGKKIHLGMFATADEARLVYEDAAKKHFGGFARLNE